MIHIGIWSGFGLSNWVSSISGLFQDRVHAGWVANDKYYDLHHT